MRKTILTLSLLLIVAASAIAHTIGVGYALRQEGSDTGLKANGKTACSAAVLLESDKLARYAGNAIYTVRASLPNTRVYVDSVVVWVRSSLNGDNLASGKITRFKDDGFGNITKGWNEVALSSPVTITDNSRLYVGYTYYQRTSVCATRIVSSTDKGVSFVKLGNDSQWTETDNGTLAVEAGMDGDDMPQNDIWLMSARGLILSDGTRQIETHLYNRGQKAINNIRFDCNGTEFNDCYDEPTDIQPDQVSKFTFNLKSAENVVPGTELSLEATQVNNVNDEYGNDNAASCLFNYLRMVLVEEFTTEECPNCPRVAGYIHDLQNGGSDVARNMAVVCHHAGYRTDRFTTSDDIAYEWFYNDGGGTFAPAVMYNRMPVGNASGGATPVTSPSSQEDIADCVSGIANQESQLIISADAHFTDNSNALAVSVRGKKLADFGNTAQRITLFLTEDDVLAESQAGSGTDTYYHQHLMRSVNTTWGDPIEWNGDEFVYSYSFPVLKEWKQKDMKVIASVGNYDSSNPANCMIENSAIAIPDNATGIKNVADNEDAHFVVGYYTIDGRQIAKPCGSVCIAKYSDGKTRKFVASTSVSLGDE